jgi:hypothetical protein
MGGRKREIFLALMQKMGAKTPGILNVIFISLLLLT